MSKWPIVPLRGHIAEVSERKGGQQVEVLSVTNANGFVRSLEVFDKQVFSEDASAYKLVRAGDLAYNPSRINVGSVACCQFQGGGAVSPMYVVVRCRPTILPSYLLYFLKSDVGLQNIRHRCEGAVRFQLKYSDLERIELAIPPVAEQERIVRLLDEAAALRRLRTQADERTTAAIPALFDEMFGPVAIRDAAWPTTSVGEICDLVNGAAFKPDDWDTTGLPIIRIQNLNDSSKPFNLCSHPMPEKYRVRKGDILLSWSGTPGTSFGCFRWGGPEGWLNQHIFNVRLKPEIDGEFFIEAINARLAELISKAHGGVGLQHVTKGTLNGVQLPRPPITIQRTFAARVAEIRALEAEQVVSRKRLDDLFQSLLHRAFSGNL